MAKSTAPKTSDVCAVCGVRYKSKLVACPKCGSGRTMKAERFMGRKPLVRGKIPKLPKR